MVNYYQAADIIINKLPEPPELMMILGSGLGRFTSNLENPIHIPYAETYHFSSTFIPGHSGEWVFGYIKSKPIICASGRFHYYEGLSLEQIVLPVTTCYALGCRTLIITNAAGCLIREWELGDLMLIEGYIDYSFINNSDAPLKILFNNNASIINKILETASYINIPVRQGIYAWVLGPTYETPAEIQDIILLGGNAVGMSTVPEIIKANELGMKIIGFSCLTNYGAGLVDESITHKQVLKVTKEIQEKFYKLMEKIISI